MPRAPLTPRLGPFQRLKDFLILLITWPFIMLFLLLALMFGEPDPGYKSTRFERVLEWIGARLTDLMVVAVIVLAAYGFDQLRRFVRSNPSAAPNPATTAVSQQPVTALASPSPMATDPEPAIVKIDSIPPGAIARVNGEDKGRTPVYFQNTYPSQRPVEVKLYLPGYKVWTGTFPGGSPAELQVTLKRP